MALAILRMQFSRKISGQPGDSSAAVWMDTQERNQRDGYIFVETRIDKAPPTLYGCEASAQRHIRQEPVSSPARAASKLMSLPGWQANVALVSKVSRRRMHGSANDWNDPGLTRCACDR